MLGDGTDLKTTKTEIILFTCEPRIWLKLLFTFTKNVMLFFLTLYTKYL